MLAAHVFPGSSSFDRGQGFTTRAVFFVGGPIDVTVGWIKRNTEHGLGDEKSKSYEIVELVQLFTPMGLKFLFAARSPEPNPSKPFQSTRSIRSEVCPEPTQSRCALQAQCIDRLMEAFAGQQYEQGKGSGRHPFVNADAAFTMAFSAIMLNTDLHNPQIQDHRRMTLEDFIRNNRSVSPAQRLSSV